MTPRRPTRAPEGATAEERRRLAESAQLLQLRRLRERHAAEQRRQAEADQAAALAAAQASEAAFKAFKAQRLQLMRTLGEGPHGVRLIAYAETRRDWLDEAAERAEYTLLDDEEALQTADHDLDLAGAEWRRARRREDAAEHLLQRTRQRAAAAGEQRSEREDLPRVPR